MAMSTWLALAGICLLYVGLGLWAVSQIFPSDRATTPDPTQTSNHRRAKTNEPQHARP